MNNPFKTGIDACLSVRKFVMIHFVLVMRSCSRVCARLPEKSNEFTPPGVLPDIEQCFGIDDGKSGLLQTGKTSASCFFLLITVVMTT